MGITSKDINWGKLFLVIILLTAVGVGGWFLYRTFLSPAGTTPETELAYTTFSGYNINTYDIEDHDGYVRIDVYVEGDDFDETDEDHLYPTTANLADTDIWEKEVDNKLIDDAKIELSDYDGNIIIVIDSGDASVFETDYMLVDMGVFDGNVEISLPLKQKPSDIGITNWFNGINALPTDNGTNVVELRLPTHTERTDWSNIHVGTDFDISNDTFDDDLTASEQEFYLDESNFCVIPVLTDMTDMVSIAKEFLMEGVSGSTARLSLRTDLPTIKLTFNDSIVKDDGVDTNTTHGVDINVETNGYTVFVDEDGDIGDTYVFIVSEHNLFDGSECKFDLDFGTNLTVSQIDIGYLEMNGYNLGQGTPAFTSVESFS